MSSRYLIMLDSGSEKRYTRKRRQKEPPNRRETTHKMKTIKMRIQKSSRPLVIFLATVVAIITSTVVANATQTITTPNAASISYNLAAGANSAAITPVTNKPVLVMCCCTTGSFQGVGQVRLLHIPSTWIIWFGLDTIQSPATITSGTSATAGHHIVYIDFSARVDIQVASADTIKVHNGDTVTRAGNVTLIW
jgi:hypothetical protein